MTTQYNVEIADMLKKVGLLRLCKDTKRDRWSARQHVDAAKILLNCGCEITSAKQARELPRIGEGIARKIEEFLTSGTLSELNQNTELIRQSEIVAMFSSIPGVGFSIGQKWYQDGYRSQGDLKEAVKVGKIKLSTMQMFGLNYLDEISQKMTRSQMEGVANYVSDSLNKIETYYVLTIVGSYRRGVTKSKDVDILIYPDPNHYRSDHYVDGVIEDWLRVMREQTVVFQEGDHSFIGLIEHNYIMRRVDIWVEPVDQIVTMLVGRTANVETNKKLRLAATKKGLKLSNHGLYVRGTRDRIVVRSEQEIFDMLGIEKDYTANYMYPSKETKSD